MATRCFARRNAKRERVKEEKNEEGRERPQSSLSRLCSVSSVRQSEVTAEKRLWSEAAAGVTSPSSRLSAFYSSARRGRPREEVLKKAFVVDWL